VIVASYISLNDGQSVGRWRSWLSHLSNKRTQKVLSSSLGRLISFFLSTTMYLYELPTTGAVMFPEFCIDLSNEKAYASYFLDATQARANLRGILKGSKRADHNEKDYLSLVKVLLPMIFLFFFIDKYYVLKIIEEYLPHIRALLNCVAHDEIGIKPELSMLGPLCNLSKLQS
jgi:hypothetical protein